MPNNNGNNPGGNNNNNIEAKINLFKS